MLVHYVLWFNTLGAAALQADGPRCAPEPGRGAEEFRGEVTRGKEFRRATRAGWIFKLVPAAHGWLLEVSVAHRETEDLSRLTPPWHSVPNPRDIAGWQFRDQDNLGPGIGTVNAAQRLREFIFSPEVGRSIRYDGGGTTLEDVAKVEAFGRGWLHVDAFRLTPPRKGDRASFERLTFSVCLTWPTPHGP